MKKQVFKRLKNSLVKIISAIFVALFFFSFQTQTLAQNCSLVVKQGLPDAGFDSIFSQNGPGQGLEPKGSAGWTGGDSTYSILLPNGDTAFFFSDSYIAESPTVKGDGTVFVNSNGLRTREPNCVPPLCPQPASAHSAYNSIVIMSADGKTMTTKVGATNERGISTSYFKPKNPAHFFWLGDAALVETDKRGTKKIWVFLYEWETNKPGEAFRLDFQGNYIAQLNASTLAIESINPLVNLKDANSAWGTALWLENKSALYLYGVKHVNGKKTPFVARVNPQTGIESVKDTKNWSAWSGKNWAADLEKAASIVPEGDSISDELSVKKFNINGQVRYLMVTMDTKDIYFNWKDIYLYSSCAPEGPFTNKYKVYTTPETGTQKLPGMTAAQKLDNKLVVYNAHLHPQFTKNGQLLISYNSNLPFGSSRGDTIYTDVYRPRFIRVHVEGLR